MVEERLRATQLRVVLVRYIFSYRRVLFTKIKMDWMGNGETPAGKGARRDPTESVANEEARRFPAGKRVVSQPTQALYHKGPKQISQQ